jgi:hypothetical protein
VEGDATEHDTEVLKALLNVSTHVLAAEGLLEEEDYGGVLLLDTTGESDHREIINIFLTKLEVLIQHLNERVDAYKKNDWTTHAVFKSAKAKGQSPTVAAGGADVMDLTVDPVVFKDEWFTDDKVFDCRRTI